VPIRPAHRSLQLTMAAGYYEAARSPSAPRSNYSCGGCRTIANFILAPGLTQAVEYLQNLRYTAEEIAYLRGLPQFAHAAAGFSTCRGAALTGDLFACPKARRSSRASRFLRCARRWWSADPETYLWRHWIPIDDRDQGRARSESRDGT